LTQDGYTEVAQSQLDRLNVEAPEVFWNAIVDSLDLILDGDESIALRRERLVGSSPNRSAWMLRVRVGDDAVAILWSELDDGPTIDWVGEWPPA
jgi:hypothetical protein